MSTPVDPVEPTPPTSDPTPAEPPVSTPSDSPTDSDIRDLVTQLIPPPPEDLFRKATVTALTLPTMTIQFPFPEGEVGVDIPDVRRLDNYTPVVGDTVLVAKQGTDLFAIGQLDTSTQGGVPQGWATLAGSVQYRLVVDNGDSRIQMKGSTSYAGTIGTLPTGFRPSVTRTFPIGRDGQASAILCSISTSGTVSIISPATQPGTTTADGGETTSASGGDVTGGTDTPAAAAGTTSSDSHTHTGPSHVHGIGHSHGGTTDVRLSGYLSLNSSDLGHAHAISTGASSAGYSDTPLAVGATGADAHSHTLGNHAHSAHTHTQPTHTHTQPTHTHDITVSPSAPTTVYFDGVNFFL